MGVVWLGMFAILVVGCTAFEVARVILRSVAECVYLPKQADVDTMLAVPESVCHDWRELGAEHMRRDLAVLLPHLTPTQRAWVGKEATRQKLEREMVKASQERLGRIAR